MMTFSWKQKVVLLLVGGVLGYLFYLGFFRLNPYRLGQMSRLNQEIWVEYDHAQHLREREFRKTLKAVNRKTPDEVREMLNN